MLKVRIFFALGIALLYFAEPYTFGLIPLAIWAVACPAFVIRNRKGLMYLEKALQSRSGRQEF